MPRPVVIGRICAITTSLWLCSSAYPQAQCPNACDDGNSCTDDLCDPTLGCVHSNNSSTCSDSNSCTTNDVCVAGTCVGGDRAASCNACSAVATIPAQGGTFFGRTSGSSTLAGSCGTSGSSAERVYQWTPTSSGTTTIGTCGLSTQYDTVVYLRSGTCTGSQVSCNDDACAITGSTSHGSRVTSTVIAGQTYYIVVDGYNGASGSFALTVQPPSNCGNGIREGAEQCDGADATQCVTGQCTAQCTCQPPPSGLPDMTPSIPDLFVQRNATVTSGDVSEGCAESTSGVDLLRFGVQANNVGTADLFLGDPQCPVCSTNPLAVCGNPNFVCSPAQGHNHAHYNNYARYELLDANGQAVVVGHKQGFCLMDSVCAHPQYSCGFQGISAGCADIYTSNLGCQYLDITGVPNGNYLLRVTVDPFGRFAELDESNNVAQTAITLTGGGTQPPPPPPPNSCDAPTVIPAAGGSFSGTTSGTSTQSGTCGTTGASPEKAYQWTPSASGAATIQTCGAGTAFDSVLYMRSGTCSGSQVSCNDNTAACTINGGAAVGSRLTPTVTAGQTYFILVDGNNGASGNFTVTVTPPTPPPPPPPSGGSCGSPTVIPAAGGVFTGTTSGSSTQSGTCGNSGASPDKVFQWTPAASGTATIQSCGAGTSFDSVLYVRSGTCTGTQLSCNDDTGGCLAGGSPNHGSRLTPTVTAGQTYFIIIDGYNGAGGSFSLTVTPPP